MNKKSVTEASLFNMSESEMLDCIATLTISGVNDIHLNEKNGRWNVFVDDWLVVKNPAGSQCGKLIDIEDVLRKFSATVDF